MRPASASRLTSPIVAEAVPPDLVISSTRLSIPPQFGSRSPGALCSLATPVGRRSETTTATPLAASARAVELPMPTGLPQPVIKATRDEWGMDVPPVQPRGQPPLGSLRSPPSPACRGGLIGRTRATVLPPPQAGEG